MSEWIVAIIVSLTTVIFALFSVWYLTREPKRWHRFEWVLIVLLWALVIFLFMTKGTGE